MMSELFDDEKKEVKVKKWHIFLIIGVILFSLGLKFYNSYTPKADIMLADKKFTFLLADTNQRRFIGLSNKDQEKIESGMVFIFSNKIQHVIVMRDMKFALDIIWVADDKVVDISKNVRPEYNVADSLLKKYYPQEPADIAIEVPVGFVDKNNIKIGDSFALLK